MKKTELRIGNIYHSVKFNKAVQMDVFDFYELSKRADGASIDDVISDIFEPIPLTDEWFEKFGFEIGFYGGQGNIHWWADYYIGGKGKIGSKKLHIWSYDNKLWMIDKILVSTEIKHVHQLQNLFHALTQQELTIK